MSLQSINLRFTGGKSDKVYNMQVDEEGSGFMVYAQNGRYGGTLTHRELTKEPVDRETALKVYNKKLQEQLSEGYQIQGDNTSGVTSTARFQEDSGNVPQLLNPIEESEIEQYLTDSDWMAQEKKDGHHQMIEVTKDRQVIVSNRKGKIIPTSTVIEKDALQLLPDGGLIDGEAIGDVYWAFDLLKMDGLDIASRGAEERYRGLETLFSITSLKQRMGLVTTAYTTDEKRTLLDYLRRFRKEGIVFKRRNSIYTPGRPNSYGDMVKFKFKGRATCTVSGVHKTKRSVQIAVLDGTDLRQVGNVTIPPNWTIPTVGTLIEVEYLYAYRNGALYQTVYFGPRTDKDEPDQYQTLKFKAEDSEETP